MAGLLALALLALVLGLALRFEPLVYLFYGLVGVYLVNRLWLGRSLGALRGTRTVGQERAGGGSDASAFLGDRVPVTVQVRNDGWLPIAWVLVQEQVPAGLQTVGGARWVLSLAPKARREVHYQLFCGRRGYYLIGPLFASGGTPWETDRSPRALAPEHAFTVYPHIVPLDQLGLPSRLPLGARRSHNPLLPDPARLVGVRDYAPGDRLRDIHWRASARLGTLQVKKFEPSQPLQVALFLDLDEAAYDFRTRERASELAIVVAASVAADVIRQRQAIGLITNGRDPLEREAAPGGAGPSPATNGDADAAAGEAAPAGAPAAPTNGHGARLTLTDRLTAAPPPAISRPRRVVVTDQTSPLSLPELTFDEDGAAYVDGPVTSAPPAAPVLVPVHDGQAHLAIVLTTLARITLRPAPREDGGRLEALPPLPFSRLVRRRAAGLPWGTTVVLVAPAPTDDLVAAMLHLRGAGYSPLAVFVQPPRLATDLDAAVVRAAGLPAFEVYDEGRLAHLQVLIGS
jgi:uncharacterized protein (DUF58 family)